MRRSELLRRRVHAHLLSGPKPSTAAEVVDHYGCVQAQDWTQGLWALGARLGRPDRVAIEAEVAAGTIVRTWPMRGTLHWVRPTEVRWLLDLMAARPMRAAQTRHRQLGLTPRDLDRAHDVVTAELGAGPCTRPELFAALDRAGTSTEGQRGVHALGWLAHQGVIVVGPRAGKQPTYRLLTEPQVAPDHPLHEIATRYVRGHGPATAPDLAMWTGLPLTVCRAALAETGAARDGDHWYVDGDPPPMPRRALLLAGFDEYVLGYRDRSPVLDDGALQRVIPGGNGVFLPSIVRAGRVVGVWRRRGSAVDVTPFGDPEADARPADARPVDARPVDARPVDARPVDARPVDARAVERFYAA